MPPALKSKINSLLNSRGNRWFDQFSSFCCNSDFDNKEDAEEEETPDLPHTIVESMEGSNKFSGAATVSDTVGAITKIFGIENLVTTTKANIMLKFKALLLQLHWLQ